MTRNHMIGVGEVLPFVAPDATVVIEAIEMGRGRVRCLGAPEHFDAEGGCAHVEHVRELNPTVGLEVLPRGGPDYEEERQIDLDWRRDRSGVVP